MSETAAAPAPAAPAAAAPVAPVAPVTAPAATVQTTVLGTEPLAKATTPATIAADFKIDAPRDTGLADDRVTALAGMVTEFAKAHADKGMTPALANVLLQTQIQAAQQDAAEKKSWTDALKASRTPDQLHADDVAVTNFVRTHFGETVIKLLIDSGHIAKPDIFNGFLKLANAGREKPMVAGVTPTGAQVSKGKAEFPRSPINWSPAERAEWEAAGRPQL